MQTLVPKIRTDSNEPAAPRTLDPQLAEVRAVARSMRRRVHREIELGDLEAWGTEGLLRALRRFRSDRGVPFLAFARPHIRGAMLDGLRRTSLIPSGLRRVEREADRILRDADSDEADAAAALERVSTRQGALAGAARVGLAERIGFAEDGLPQAVSRAPGPEDDAARAELREILRGALRELEPKEAEILMRHAAGDESLDDIARSLGMSAGTASRLYQRACRRLRRPLLNAAGGWTRPA